MKRCVSRPGRLCRAEESHITRYNGTWFLHDSGGGNDDQERGAHDPGEEGGRASSDRHVAKECAARCGDCGLKCCPGAHGAECAVKNEVDLGACADGAGRPLDDYCKEKITAVCAKPGQAATGAGGSAT